MAFSLILVLLSLMATGGSRRGRKSVSRLTRAAEESEGSDPEYQIGEEVEEEEEGDDDAEVEEPISRADKGKGIAGESSRGGGSRTRERRAKRMADISSERLRAYSSKSCIAERHVSFRDLIAEVPDFGHLLLRAPIEPLGNVGARTPFCVELIREFYMRGVVSADDEETGTYVFETTVRGKSVTVTPHDIGGLLGLVVDTSGIHYTAGPFQSTSHWDIVIDAICRPGAHTDRLVVESKDLLPEYHLLSLITNYNVLPTIGTKRIRWDRLLFLYLLGHPEAAFGMNMCIPFLIWQRMIHVIRSSGRRELLPFPLLITRILRANGIDTACSKYDYGLGPIDAVTLAKSVSTIKTFQKSKEAPPHATSSTATPAPPPPPPPRRAAREASSSSGERVTLDSLHHDVGRLHHEVSSFKKGFQRLEKGMKRILEKLGCTHDDIFPSSSVYQRSTSRHPFLPGVGPATGSQAGHDDDDGSQAGHDDDEATE